MQPLRALLRTHLFSSSCAASAESFPTVIDPSKKRPGFQLGTVNSRGTTRRFYAHVEVCKLEDIVGKSGDALQPTFEGQDIVALEQEVGMEYSQFYAILLDGEVIRTKSQFPISVPNKMLAHAIAIEWDSQGKFIKPVTMPLSTLATSSFDVFGKNARQTRDDCAGMMHTLLGSDLVMYREDFPLDLKRKQSQHWDHLVKWFAIEYGVEIPVIQGLALNETESERDARSQLLRKNVVDRLFTETCTPFQLSAIHHMNSITKSVVITLALHHGIITPKQAVDASRVDFDHNIENWGRISDGVWSHDIDIAFANMQIHAAALFLQLMSPPGDSSSTSVNKQPDAEQPQPLAAHAE